MDEQEAKQRRLAMVRQIERNARDAARYTSRPVLDGRVLAAMARVPRHEFVPAEAEDAAYDDAALPIGRGQTISQPYVVALMTDLARPKPEDVVLEVGSGCGYQTAVLAELVSRVYSLELDPELAAAAGARLSRLGYENVEVRAGDGHQGWRKHAPFGAILVTAAAREIPPPLIDQLAPGARLVIPVGGARFGQELLVVERDEAGRTTTQEVLPVAFVPLRRPPPAEGRTSEEEDT